MNKITPNTSAQIIQMYNDGQGTISIAQELGYHRMTIQKLLRRNGIGLRKTSPWKNTYDIKFFSKYTAESCYWAGFILADGCLRSDRATLAIKLANKDREHLDKFKKAINFAGDIKYDSPNGKDNYGKNKQCSIIEVNGKWFLDDLGLNFDIFPQKTYTIRLTRKVPQKYLHHFIRGIIDGDGGISRTGEAPTMNIAGTAALLHSLSWLFYDLGVRLKSRNDVPPIRPKNGVGQISYSCSNAKLILDWMYQESNDEIRLSRKYDRYQSYFIDY